MDKELEALALLALRNAFYREFSGLCNLYLKAAEGLDVDAQELMMGDMTSIYGRDTEADSDHHMNIWTPLTRSGFFMANTGHDTIKEALEQPEAFEVYLRGEKVFEKRDGEWYFVG